MITLPYSLVIEATEDPDFFGFYSADLDGFTGIGHLIEDCLYKSRWGNGRPCPDVARARLARPNAESKSDHRDSE